MNKKNPTLGDFKVNHDDIIALHKDGPRLIEIYNLIKGWEADGLSVKDITNELKNWWEENEDISRYKDKNSFVSSMRSRVRNVIDTGLRPRSIHSIETLESLGFLPLDMNSPSFRLLNIFLGFTFWNGNLTGSESKYQPFISVKKNSLSHQEEVFQLCLDGMGCNYFLANKASGDMGFLPQAELSRLMIAMGYSAGRKNKNGLIAPDYMYNVINSYTVIDPNIDLEEKKLAYELMHDFVLSLFFSKGGIDSSRFYLHTFKARELASSQINLISKMIRITFPSLNFNEKIYSTNRGGYVSCIQSDTEILDHSIVNELMKKRVQKCVQTHRDSLQETLSS